MFNDANRGKIALSERGGVVSLTRKDVPEFQLRKRVHDADYPYRKVVTCSECRQPLYGSAAKGRNKYYPGYQCNHRGHYFRVRKEEFESTIERFVHEDNFYSRAY